MHVSQDTVFQHKDIIAVIKLGYTIVFTPPFVLSIFHYFYQTKQFIYNCLLLLAISLFIPFYFTFCPLLLIITLAILTILARLF